MNDFRLVVPKRRNNPRNVKRYGLHQDDLIEDFENCCGYCGDNDGFSGGKRFYQIDHFVPKSLKLIDETNYSNLIYSCFYCNNRKSNDWPTGKADVHNDGTKGYIDPCHDDFPKQFKRNNRGDIVPCSPLGEYMHLHLNLGLRRHALIWALARLEKRVKILREYKSEGFLDDKISEYCIFLDEYFDGMMALRDINNE